METKSREMTREETNVFLRLATAEDKNIDELFSALMAEPGGWVLEAIEKRFKVLHDMIADKRVMIFILIIGDGTVGICAKYVDDIASHKITPITWEKFTREIYPLGIPVL